MAIKVSGTTVIDNDRNVLNISTVDLQGSNTLIIPTGNTAARPLSPSTGALRFNTDTGSTEIYNGSRFTTISTGLSYTFTTANTTIPVGNFGYIVNTTNGAVVLTLPANSNINDTIHITDYGQSFANNSCTVARPSNTINIMGRLEDLVIDVSEVNVTLVYVDSDRGWVITHLY